MDILLGPLHFLMDVAPENRVTGVFLCIAFVVCVGAFALRRNLATTILLIIAIGGWLLVGLLGSGIGC